MQQCVFQIAGPPIKTESIRKEEAEGMLGKISYWPSSCRRWRDDITSSIIINNSCITMYYRLQGLAVTVIIGTCYLTVNTEVNPVFVNKLVSAARNGWKVRRHINREHSVEASGDVAAALTWQDFACNCENSFLESSTCLLEGRNHIVG